MRSGERVKAKLERDGLSRAMSASHSFPRSLALALASVILREEGWTFTTENTGRDYIYRHVSKPVPKTLALSI